jgi:phosphohistidine phosphatase SixA
LVAHLKVSKDAKRVMLVGHEPQLGTLVAALLGREDAALSLKKGACVALELDPDKDDKPAVFLWYQVPGKKLSTSFKKAFP